MTTKSVLVTGASTGIGAACAVHMDRRGWQVFAGVRREEDAAKLRQQASENLVPVLLDVTDEAGVAAATATICEVVGDRGLAGVVNNAGIALGGPVEFLPLEEWREQFEVNVIGQLAVTKAAMPLLRDAKGRIVFVGSISGRISSPLVAPYSASKHAIEAIAFALREELRPWDIKVAVVEPGVVKTPIWEKAQATADRVEAALGDEATRLYKDQVDAIRASVTKNASKGVEPEKVAQAIEHALTSARPRHRYLVGSDAVVGGFLARVVPDRLWAPLSRRLAAL